MNETAKWIWYRGDFEIYHGMRQNFAREERGFGWVAYWNLDDWEKNVKFIRDYELAEATAFAVHGCGVGYVAVDGEKHPFETKVTVSAGRHRIEIFIGNMTGLPCVFIDSAVIKTNESWTADNFLEGHPAGTSSLFTDASQNPNEVPYTEHTVTPKDCREVDGGMLFDFGRMLNHATVAVTLIGLDAVTLAYGESEAEATDLTWCYYKQENVDESTETRQRAFRYIYVPHAGREQVRLSAVHRQVDIPVRADFACDDARLTRIWEVAKETYRLCSELFFIDGIKRDRWIWAGDAYQSFFVNPYLFFDKEINQRTTRAVRGATPIVQHLNTIVDYSMLWVISLWNEYELYGDADFLWEMLPKAQAMMELLLAQTNEEGFLYGRERDWIYIDWADMDKDGCISGEQILLWKCLCVMRDILTLREADEEEVTPRTAALAGVRLDARYYGGRAERLRDAIHEKYWDSDRGAFIDSYTSGRRSVTRHANIFAILFGFVDEEKKQSILKRVLFNDAIPAITTPYFKFFELDVLAQCGCLDAVMETITSYWGGMLDEGAVTFWEQYDPTKTGREHYEMYGDPFGKSLCHAWAASPIYLLGRYFLGVRPTAVGYETFVVEPRLTYFKELDATVPVAGGAVHISYKDGRLLVTSDRKGGTLIVGGEKTPIEVRG